MTTFTRAPQGQSIYDANGKRVARMAMNRKTWREDANLLCAAPELRSALERVVELLDNDGYSDATHTCIRDARQAIAKAKGRERS